jgi:hypothetical protein
LWTAVMLVFLLGDVIRIFAGDFTSGELVGKPASQGMWLLIAIIMLVPIVMIVLSLLLPYPLVRWLTIGVALAFVVFNLVGLPYPGMYDNFLIVVSFVFCGLIIWYAWGW